MAEAEEKDLRAALRGVLTAVDQATELDRKGPDQFRTRQEHLPPAFREVQWEDAFRALAVIMTDVERAVEPIRGLMEVDET